jgi:hypothetical protein
MSTIKATLEADADGTLHLPLPPELREGKLTVTATIQSANEPDLRLKGFGCLKGKIWMAADFDAPLDDFKEYVE